MSVVVTRVGQITRTVSDLETSIKWYQKYLGLRCQFQFEGMAFLICDGIRIMLSRADVVQPESILYFEIRDLKSAIKALELKGVTILQMPHKIHQHGDGTQEWMAFINDPDQRPIGLIEKLHPPADDPE
ncbi:glyoxalase [Arenicella chitinivorans]|uniref:Glyoxalase n=1 Tax=Arenicella chitinivorans TaxID=1329800 RepID=A0A918VH20_9GAMM|nr:VOC family protein [Arenicella chitinivorans]GGZ97125.1 glyoxalase [Arenicella chitinivorans]